MVRLRSDVVQVVLLAILGKVLGLGLGLVVAYGFLYGFLGAIPSLLVVVPGWRQFEWQRSPLRVTGMTALAIAAFSLLFGTFIFGLPMMTLVTQVISVLLVGGAISQVRPQFFGRLSATAAADEGAPSRERSAAPAERGTAREAATTGGEAPARSGSSGGRAGAADGSTGTGSVSAGAGSGSTAPGRSAGTVGTTAGHFDVEYGDFEVGEHIGSGGNADVHLATVALPDGPREVALKTPRVAGGDTVGADFFEQFREEAQTWDRLDDHERVVTVHDWGERPQPWIALEYMEAGDLNEWRDHLDYYGKLAALTDVSEAVHHAHTHGVNHTDLKPGNVMFTEQTGEGGEPWVAKVGDWGLANVLLEHSQSVEGFTPDYAAPEQVDPDQFGRTDHQTDIYQLGVVAYELLTGQLPFDRDHQAATMNAILNERPEPPSSVNPDLPPEVDDVLLQALAKEKTDRQDAMVYLRDAFRDME